MSRNEYSYRITKFFTEIFFFLVCISTARGTTPSTTNDSDSLTNAIAKFERGNQALAGKFLYHLLQSRPGENFMISGFSILVALAQLALYAVGTTLEQLRRLLNLDTDDEIRIVFPELIKIYNSQKDVIFALAIKYYSNKYYPFSDEFKEDSSTVFDSGVESLDFGKPEQAANIINNWVEENTNGLIKELVNGNMFNTDTRCVLVNALYFLGNWQKPFNKENTQRRDFYVDEDNTASIETMYQKGKFAYAENDYLNCQIIRIPYKNGNFSFWIYLPNERLGLQKMIEKFQEPDILADSMGTLSMKTVEMYVPVLEFESNISDLTDLLRKVNLTEPFKTNSDGFTGILEEERPLYISGAIQKTKVIVNEKGTEAAAATAVILMTRTLARPESEIYTFQADHPFAFFITSDNFIFFEGCYLR